MVSRNCRNAVSKICAFEVARTGLQEKEQQKIGTDYATATVETKTSAGHYPGASVIKVKMIGDKTAVDFWVLKLLVWKVRQNGLMLLQRH